MTGRTRNPPLRQRPMTRAARPSRTRTEVLAPVVVGPALLGLGLLGLALLGLALGLIWAPESRAAEAPAPTILELTELNGVWIDPAPPELAPIKRGPMTVTISSPHQRVAIHRNRVRLRPLGDGRVAAFFEVELEGEGEIIAVLQAGMRSRFEDEVTLPRQTLRMTGIVRLAEDPAGLRIILEELPPVLELRIESRMLGNLISACRGFGSFLPIDCDGFGRDLETVKIPTPPAGESVLLPASYLTAEERAILARFIER